MMKNDLLWVSSQHPLVSPSNCFPQSLRLKAALSRRDGETLRLGESWPSQVLGLAMHPPAEPLKPKGHFQPQWTALVHGVCSLATLSLVPFIAACVSKSSHGAFPFEACSHLYLGSLSGLGIRNHSHETCDTPAKQNAAFLCAPRRLRTISHWILFCLALSTSPLWQKHYVKSEMEALFPGNHCGMPFLNGYCGCE